MRSIRVFTIIIAGLLGGLVLLYLTSPWWLRLSLNVFLPEDIELVELLVERPRIDNLKVPVAVVRINDAGQQRLQVNASNSVLRFSWRSLLAGRLTQLQINNLALLLPPRQPATSDAAAASIDPANFLPQNLISMAPLAELEITSLRLGKPDDTNFTALQGYANLADGVFSLNISSREMPDWQAVFRADEHNAVQLSIMDAKMPALSLSAAVESPATGVHKLNATTSAELARLNSLLNKLSLLPAELMLAGQLHSSWSLQLPSGLTPSVLANMQLEGTVEGKFSAGYPSMGTVQCASTTLTDNATIAHFSLADGSVRLTPQLSCNAESSALTLPDFISLPATERKLRYELRTGPETILQARAELHGMELVSGGVNIKVNNNAAKKEASLQAAVRIDTGKFNLHQVTGKSHASQLRQPIEKSGQLTFSGELKIPAVIAKPYSANNIALQINGGVSFSGAAARLQINKGASLTAHKLRWQDGAVAKAHICGETDMQIHYADNAFSLRNAKLGATSPAVTAFGQNFKYRELGLSVREFTVKPGTPAHLSGQLQLSAADLTVPAGELRSSPLRVNVDVTAKDQTLAGKISVRPRAAALAKKVRIHGEFSHNITSNRGRAQLRTPVMGFTEAQHFLPPLFENWPYPLDLSAGKLQADADLDWRPDFTAAAVRLHLDQLGGFYQRNLFSGLTGDVTVDYRNGKTQISGNRLSLAKVDVGFPVDNIKLELKKEVNAIGIRRLNAAVFGGRVSIQNAAYVWAQPDNQFTIKLSGINLAQLLKLESGISGSGTIDGHLPVTVSADAVVINGGELHVRPPGGVIRYVGDVPSGALGSNPQLELAVTALRNFHYQVLDIDADYAENGKLSLKARLQGRNPTMANNRPVHFNLNVTENIPALLQSLQLTQVITDKLDARIQQLYTPQQ